MMKIFTTLLVLCALLVSGEANALSVSAVDIRPTFRTVAPIRIPEIKVPTAVEVPLPDNTWGNVLIYNKTTGAPQPTLIVGTESKEILPTEQRAMTDGSYGTHEEFFLPENAGAGNISINLNYNQTVRSNSLYLALDQYVALPTSITIKAVINGETRVVISNIVPSSGQILFPETTAKDWMVEMRFGQPLRIKELQLRNLDTVSSYRAVRFLAQPNNEYSIYGNPEVWGAVDTGEAPNLSNNVGVVKTSSIEFQMNPLFKEADSDNDGVADVRDNCVYNANPEQEDIDDNSRGDVCDDYDRDGVINSIDNCINEPNRNQADIDLDKIGDSCDSEESRITEKYPWIVWGGIIFALLVFLGLFAYTINQTRKSTNISPPPTTPPASPSI